MKQIVATLLIVVSSSSLSAKSDIIRKINGMAELTKQSYHALEVNGEATLTEVVVDTKLDINGKGHLTDCTVRDLCINGDAKISKGSVSGKFETNGDCKINDAEVLGECTMNGTIKAFDTSFFGDMTVCSSKLVLKKCVTKNITIRKNQASDNFFSSCWNSTLKFFGLGKESSDIQEVKLVDTEVQGDIEFEGKNGVVYVEGNSTFQKVLGGRVEKI